MKLAAAAVIVSGTASCSLGAQLDGTVPAKVQGKADASAAAPAINPKTRLIGTALASPFEAPVHAEANRLEEPVRGIYVSGYAAGSRRVMGRLKELVDRTELNAMVIDIKDDYGLMTYASHIKLANRLGTDSRPLIDDPKELIDQLHRAGIYVIGRQVVFKDALLASKVPDWAIHEKSGKVWRDAKRKAWINPYRKEVWNYNIAIAQEAAELGFDEIQFDYVRFPANGAATEAKLDYGSEAGAKSEAIGAFLGESAAAIHRKGAKVSADVFGLVTSSSDDMGIGQSWRTVASQVDSISPMVYPSHYSPGMYGIATPDLSPFEVIHKAMTDASSRNRHLLQGGTQPAAIRPWLQSFTATWLHPHRIYGEAELREQIRAAKEAGVDEYLLWSPKCLYPMSANQAGAPS
ncbi:putative glycoside hydrolase [Paenibacillus albicereus]|uniref:Putative glycoside hydrolase n=1 Tax=Paenibacillus albicereus TaxID=2726185 RepID=A0A6H2GS74_9BACL|nr:putative glycoside hydrolase [Paenibacillus albicereus]QJC50245.1 putative glycoside hydrolase [Paenibacillus albicereus]